MDKKKLIFITLLFICASLLGYSGYLLKSNADLDQSQRSGLIRQGDEYILWLDITNNALIDSNYTICMLIDEKRYNESIFLGAGRIFTYEHHIYPPLENNWVNVSVYKEDEADPISKNTYFIK